MACDIQAMRLRDTEECCREKSTRAALLNEFIYLVHIHIAQMTPNKWVVVREKVF